MTPLELMHLRHERRRKSLFWIIKRKLEGMHK